MFRTDKAEALSLVFTDLTTTFTTNQGLASETSAIRSAIAETRSDLSAEIAEVRADLRAEIADTRSNLRIEIEAVRTQLSAMEARMTWRIIGAMGFFATVMTLLAAFID